MRIWWVAAKVLAESAVREPTAARRPRLDALTPTANWRAMLPVPRMAQARGGLGRVMRGRLKPKACADAKAMGRPDIGMLRATDPGRRCGRWLPSLCPGVLEGKL